MLYGDYQRRYRKLVEELQNDFTKGNGNQPENTTDENNLLIIYKPSYNPPTRLVDDSEEVSFTNVGGNKGNYK